MTAAGLHRIDPLFTEARGTRGYDDLAIDPGTHTGWAVFNEDGALKACGIGEPPFPSPYRRVVIELPQVYPTSPVPPNDLVTLAFLAGRYAGAAAGAEVFTVFPHTWKGNLSKAVCAARVKERLSREERVVVEKCLVQVPEKQRHNVWDAIGIGLFAFRQVKV